jgi:predicted transcriptional regulator
MNPRRLSIFQYLWNNPCSHIRQISRGTNIPLETLKWHLKSLERSGLLASKKFGRKVAFYPKGLIRTIDVRIFAQISAPVRQRIIKLLYKNPDGVKLGEISSELSMSKQALNHHLSLLADQSIIKGQKGKKPAVYRIHENLTNLIDIYKNRTDEVLNWLLPALEKDCLNPKPGDKRGDKIRIKLSLGVKKKNIRFVLNPIQNIF